MALLGNAQSHSKAISLDDGALRTNGVLVGRILYSLFYTSSSELYAENLDTAVSALEASVWTTDFDPSLALDVAG